MEDVISNLYQILFLACVVFVPVACFGNFVFLFFGCKKEKKKIRNIIWFLTPIVGLFDTYNCLWFCEVQFTKLWSEQLYNQQTHQPLWLGGIVTLIVVFAVGIVGAVVLVATDVNKVPPLVTVLCIAALYLMLVISLVWCIQIIRPLNEIIIMFCPLLPGNLIMIAITIIREKIKQWNSAEHHADDEFGKNSFIKRLNSILMKSEKWPIYAAVLMLPLLGVIVAILVLFGQEPDAIIKVWTETSDWTLSQKVGPQNIYYDEHYLCTVAAGGHRKVVKPLRMGERHGHKVIVNRQLMIANAFENVLEEKTPKMHRLIRNFYDKYGFPIADYIRTNKVACDITYFVMKPLEWLFLIVLYLVDTNPENRIAVQYMPRKINND